MAVGRRFPPPIPTGVTPSPERVWTLLLSLWRYVVNGYSGLPAPHEETHLAGGADPLTTPGTPTTVSLANAAVAADVGDGPSYAYENHSHGIIKRDVRVMAVGVDVGTRNAISFSDAFIVTDNSGSDRVDIEPNGLSPLDLEFLDWTL